MYFTIHCITWTAGALRQDQCILRNATKIKKISNEHKDTPSQKLNEGNVNTESKLCIDWTSDISNVRSHI